MSKSTSLGQALFKLPVNGPAPCDSRPGLGDWSTEGGLMPKLTLIRFPNCLPQPSQTKSLHFPESATCEEL